MPRKPANIRGRQGLYWATWQGAKKELAKRGFDDAEIEGMRHECHKLALDGKDPSSKEIVKDQRLLTPVLKEFRVYAEPANLKAQLADQDPRQILIRQIEKKGLPDPYLDKIARTQFKVSAWRDLGEYQLECLRHTATRVARRKAAQL